MLLLGAAVQFLIVGAWTLEQQLAWGGVALIVMLAAYFADFTIVGKYPKLVFSLLSVITVFCCFFTGTVRGAASKPASRFGILKTGFVYSLRPFHLKRSL